MHFQATAISIGNGLSRIGQWVGILPLRLLIAWEFYEAGIAKFNGKNWFGNIVDNFPFPFNIIPIEISWFLATWTEIVAAITLAIGLATRFSVTSLIILDIVAWVSVHADNGYNVCSNGYKLPLLYLIMMIPILLHGPGKLSIDYLIRRIYR